MLKAGTKQANSESGSLHFFSSETLELIFVVTVFGSMFDTFRKKNVYDNPNPTNIIARVSVPAESPEAALLPRFWGAIPKLYRHQSCFELNW